MSDFEVVANLPQEIKIGDKTYMIKAPSIGVTAIVARKMKALLDLMGFDIKKYGDDTKLEKLVTDILKGIYSLIVSEQNEQAVDLVCQILALLINNSPEEKTITVEEIKWNLTLNDFMPFLIKLIRMADLSDFFLLLLKMAQAYDIEGILSNSQS